MAWILYAAHGGKNHVDLAFDPDLEGAYASGSALVQDGDPPAERSLRFRARAETTRKTVPNIWYIAERWCMDHRAKDAIEAVDPGRHIFHPLDFTMKNGEPMAGGPFFTAYFQGRVDCVDTDASLVEVVTTATGRTRYMTKTGRPKLTVKRAEIAGRHAWYCDKMVRILMLSDALHARMVAEKIKGPEFLPVAER
ncbi:MAG: DUF1629 domain-containing protein [Pseudomonadota bacterium]